MAKAPSLRKDWTKGTQRTRKLSTGNALWRLRKWEGTLRGASGSRRKIAGVKPGAVKAASPVLNGGDEETGLCRPRLVATQLECGRGFLKGASDDGGLEEVVEFCASRASNISTRSCSCA